MGLITMKQAMAEARADKRGIGAFNVGNMEMVIGAVKAAEDLNTPIIMQIAEKRMGHSPFRLMGPMMVSAAKAAKVDIALNLDHGLTLNCVKEALGYGFTSVMFDSSLSPFEENIARTKEVVSLAKETSATVEAELGLVGGNEGNGDHDILCTDPGQAEIFCRETGIDCLAVAIGNAHGNYPVAPRLAFDVLEEINKRVSPLPLVLHGGTGISDEDFRKAISLGIVKINIATANFDATARGAASYLSAEGSHNYFGLNEAMVEGIYENIVRHIKIFNCK